METLMAKANLSMDDFTRYFEAKRLGKLYFPNGQCIIPHGEVFEHADFSNFFINLSDLYKMVIEWKVNHTSIPLDDTVAVIAFGSAVRYPGFQEISRVRRKYFLFGEKVVKTQNIPIQPNDADFLVITGSDLIRDVTLESKSIDVYGGGCWIKEGGIHLLNRGVDQLLKGTLLNDTVSQSALREGVPLFFDSRFSAVSSQVGIVSTTPRNIFWDEDNDGFLTGTIQ